MERDLIMFNAKISKVTKDIACYEDEKGNYNLIPIGQLMCGCEYLELDEIGFKKALYEKLVSKTEKYKTIKTTKAVDKSTVTGNKKDQGTIIDKEVGVKQVWVVKNPIGLAKAFNTKKEALACLKAINTKYLEMAELK